MSKDKLPAKKDISDFKFEAYVTCFDRPIALKPMEGDEIGFRAKSDNDAITVSAAQLVQADIIEPDGAALEFIPAETKIKTLMYNRKTKSLEIAVKAFFSKGGPVKSDDEEYKKAIGEEKDAKKQVLLLKQLAEDRGISIDTFKVEGRGSEAKVTPTQKTLKVLNKELEVAQPFILNKYPEVFTVDEIAIYYSPKTTTTP